MSQNITKQAVEKAIQSGRFTKNIMTFLQNDPKKRVLTLTSGHKITYIDEHILYYDKETNEYMGFQDEIVYVAEQINADGSKGPHYLGLDWKNVNQEKFLLNITEQDAHDAFYGGAAEAALKCLIPKRP